MKKLFIIIFMINSVFISQSKADTVNTVLLRDSTFYQEVDSIMFNSIKDSLMLINNLEFRYWNIVYTEFNSSELTNLKNGFYPERTNYLSDKSWIKFTNNEDNREVFNKVYVHLSITHFNDIELIRLEFICGSLEELNIN